MQKFELLYNNAFSANTDANVLLGNVQQENLYETQQNVNLNQEYFSYTSQNGIGIVNDLNVKAYLDKPENEKIAIKFVEYLKNNFTIDEFRDLFYDNKKLADFFNSYYRKYINYSNQGQNDNVSNPDIDLNEKKKFLFDGDEKYLKTNSLTNYYATNIDNSGNRLPDNFNDTTISSDYINFSGANENYYINVNLKKNEKIIFTDDFSEYFKDKCEETINYTKYTYKENVIQVNLYGNIDEIQRLQSLTNSTYGPSKETISYYTGLLPDNFLPLLNNSNNTISQQNNQQPTITLSDGVYYDVLNTEVINIPISYDQNWLYNVLHYVENFGWTLEYSTLFKKSNFKSFDEFSKWFYFKYKPFSPPFSNPEDVKKKYIYQQVIDLIPQTNSLFQNPIFGLGVGGQTSSGPSGYPDTGSAGDSFGFGGDSLASTDPFFEDSTGVSEGSGGGGGNSGGDSGGRYANNKNDGIVKNNNNLRNKRTRNVGRYDNNQSSSAFRNSNNTVSTNNTSGGNTGSVPVTGSVVGTSVGGTSVGSNTTSVPVTGPIGGTNVGGNTTSVPVTGPIGGTSVGGGTTGGNTGSISLSSVNSVPVGGDPVSLSTSVSTIGGATGGGTTGGGAIIGGGSLSTSLNTSGFIGLPSGSLSVGNNVSVPNLYLPLFSFVKNPYWDYLNFIGQPFDENSTNTLKITIRKNEPNFYGNVNLKFEYFSPALKGSENGFNNFNMNEFNTNENVKIIRFEVGDNYKDVYINIYKNWPVRVPIVFSLRPSSNPNQVFQYLVIYLEQFYELSTYYSNEYLEVFSSNKCKLMYNGFVDQKYDDNFLERYRPDNLPLNYTNIPTSSSGFNILGGFSPIDETSINQRLYEIFNDSTINLANLARTLNIPQSAIYNIYIYGSHYFEKAQARSDADIIIVADIPQDRAYFVSNGIDFSVYSPLRFQYQLNQFSVFVSDTESLLYDGAFFVYFTQDTTYKLLQRIEFTTNITRQELKTKSIEVSDSHFKKAEEYFRSKNLRRFQKTLWNSIRVLMFTIQYLKYGQIIDRKAVNPYLEDVEKPFETFEDVKAYFLPIIRNYKDEILSL